MVKFKNIEMNCGVLKCITRSKGNITDGIIAKYHSNTSKRAFPIFYDLKSGNINIVGWEDFSSEEYAELVEEIRKAVNTLELG